MAVVMQQGYSLDISSINFFTLSFISSLARRNSFIISASVPTVPTGSLIGQWMRFILGGVQGHVSSAFPQSVTTMSISLSNFSSISLDFCLDMSIPISCMTAIALLWTPAAMRPALWTSINPLPNSFANPSAIWLLQEFAVHKNIAFFIGIAL